MKESKPLLPEAGTASNIAPLVIASTMALSFVTRYYLLLRSSSL
jgi:hypothetical protein